MKNVTVTLEEEVARWARVWAAKHNVNVSQMLGEFLKEKMIQDEGYEAAMSQFLARNPYVRSGLRRTANHQPI